MCRRFLLLLTLFVATWAAGGDKPQNWLQLRSPHFLIVSNAGEKQVRKVAGQFERMRQVFHVLFPALQVDPAMPIVVLAIKDEKDFRALEPQEYLGKGKLHLGGLFLRTPEKNYILMRLDAQGEHPYSVIYHEYTHLLTSKAEEWMPLWLNEGLAEFFQNTEIHENDISLGEPSSDDLLLLRQNRLLPLATLFTVDRTSPYYHEENKGSIFYAQSWTLTHYLEVKDRQESTHRLSDYVTLVSQKVDPVSAATRAFGDLQQMQKTLEKYVEQSSYSYFKMNTPTPVDESTFTAEALPAVQADTVRADFLAYNRRTADARVLLDGVLRQDPNNAAARETLGFLAFQEGHPEEARKWYAEAVKLDSHSYMAHYYFAAMSMNGVALDPSEEAQIESSLRAAIKLNPAFAPSYDRLAVFYGMRRRNLDEAHMMALNAVQLDPANLSYRLNSANVLMAMEQPENAIRVIQNALNLAKSPAERDHLEMLLSQAQKYEAARQQMEANQRSDAAGSARLPDSEAKVDAGETVFLHREEMAPQGPRHSLSGVIRNVHCGAPSSLDFDLAAGAQTMSLHSGNYLKINFTAVNFTPTEELKPCSQLEGATAKVEFIDPADKAAKRWIVAVEVHK
jgi:cytochrome c-type biogenesis protein CcmH/NrfG